MVNVSPARVAAYVAMAAVLLLVGWNSLRSEDEPGRGVQVERLASNGAGSSDSLGTEARTTDPGSSGLSLGAGSRRIVVDVSGEVKQPGVYGFSHGQRVIDAIRRAGGPTAGAYAAGINRAAVLTDGQQVIVPSRSGGGTGAPNGAGAVAGSAGPVAVDPPISLGSATQAQLEEIEGIGPVTAQSILEFRDSQGGISSIEELDQVTGIGPVTMEALKSRLQP
jgi:competence protein ComEA